MAFCCDCRLEQEYCRVAPVGIICTAAQSLSKVASDRSSPGQHCLQFRYYSLKGYLVWGNKDYSILVFLFGPLIILGDYHTIV